MKPPSTSKAKKEEVNKYLTSSTSQPGTKFYHNKKFWWSPDLRKDIEEEWKQCKKCAHCKKSKIQSPPLFPVDLMAFDVGELWSLDLFEFNKSTFSSALIRLVSTSC